MTKYFLLMTPGKEDDLVLPLETIAETFSSISVLDFCMTATVGEAIMAGPQVVVRLDHSCVRREPNGRCRIRQVGGSLEGKTSLLPR
jgi:hypothetical protein